MVEDTAPQPSTGEAPNGGREEGRVWAAVYAALLIAFVGLVDGLTMAFKRKVAPCPNGKEFPEGTTDFNCYVHPHGGVGVAIAVFSLLLGILVVFSGISAAASLRARSTTGAGHHSSPAE